MATSIRAITSMRNTPPGSLVMYGNAPNNVRVKPMPKATRIGSMKIALMFIRSPHTARERQTTRCQRQRQTVNLNCTKLGIEYLAACYAPSSVPCQAVCSAGYTAHSRMWIPRFTSQMAAILTTFALISGTVKRSAIYLLQPTNRRIDNSVTTE